MTQTAIKIPSPGRAVSARLEIGIWCFLGHWTLVIPRSRAVVRVSPTRFTGPATLDGIRIVGYVAQTLWKA